MRKKIRRRIWQIPTIKKPKEHTKSHATELWAKLSKTEPNNQELLLLGMITYLGLPYKWTGNAQFVLAGCCPDFLHSNGEKKVIELFGEKWHRPEEEPARLELFKNNGYKTLIIWGKQLQRAYRRRLFAKLQAFNNE